MIPTISANMSKMLKALNDFPNDPEEIALLTSADIRNANEEEKLSKANMHRQYIETIKDRFEMMFSYENESFDAIRKIVFGDDIESYKEQKDLYLEIFSKCVVLKSYDPQNKVAQFADYSLENRLKEHELCFRVESISNFPLKENGLYYFVFFRRKCCCVVMTDATNDFVKLTPLQFYTIGQKSLYNMRIAEMKDDKFAKFVKEVGGIAIEGLDNANLVAQAMSDKHKQRFIAYALIECTYNDVDVSDEYRQEFDASLAKSIFCLKNPSPIFKMIPEYESDLIFASSGKNTNA